MKITDESLINGFWQASLKKLASGVLHNYVGGRTGLCRNDEFWCSSSMGIHTWSLHTITDKLKRKQLVSRVRSLIAQNIINDDQARNLVFNLNHSQSKFAFESCLDWWQDKGITNKPIEKPENLAELISECERFLFDNYESVELNTSNV